MSTTTSLLTASAVLLLILNLYACIRVATSTFYSRGQKIAQCMLIWVLPFAGAAGILFFLQTQETYSPPNQDKDFTPETHEEG